MMSGFTLSLGKNSRGHQSCLAQFIISLSVEVLFDDMVAG